LPHATLFKAYPKGTWIFFDKALRSLVQLLEDCSSPSLEMAHNLNQINDVLLSHESMNFMPSVRLLYFLQCYQELNLFLIIGINEFDLMMLLQLQLGLIQ